MKTNKLIFAVLLTASAPVFAVKPGTEPPPPEPTGNLTYQFAGFSTQTLTGASGINNMHRICQEDLNNDAARMCSTKEFIESPTISSIEFGGPIGWVHPVIMVLNNSLNTDYSGVNSQYPSCAGWAQPSYSSGGLVVDASGEPLRIRNNACSTMNHVTCCTPQ